MTGEPIGYGYQPEGEQERERRDRAFHDDNWPRNFNKQFENEHMVNSYYSNDSTKALIQIDRYMLIPPTRVFANRDGFENSDCGKLYSKMNLDNACDMLIHWSLPSKTSGRNDYKEYMQAKLEESVDDSNFGALGYIFRDDRRANIIVERAVFEEHYQWPINEQRHFDGFRSMPRNNSNCCVTWSTIGCPTTQHGCFASGEARWNSRRHPPWRCKVRQAAQAFAGYTSAKAFSDEEAAAPNYSPRISSTQCVICGDELPFNYNGETCVRCSGMICEKCIREKRIHMHIY